MDDNSASKIDSLVNNYKSLNINERSQFIGTLIGEENLLKEMGMWFDPSPFTTLFKTEFEKGAREKVLMGLTEIDINDKDKPLEIFWITSPFNEQNTLFQQIMKSKDYQIVEKECILDYDDPTCVIQNNVELGSQYPLAFKFIEYDTACKFGKVIKGSRGGSKVKVKGYLAFMSF
jgi:hypothetical protein